MTGAEKKIILALNRPLGIIKMPFAPLARQLGFSDKRLFKVIGDLKRRGIIRRLGAVLAHRRIGLRANVLVSWKVPKNKSAAALKIFRASPQISHCYQRKTCPSWPYNIYTMVHARNRNDCLKIVRSISRKAGIKEYRELFTLKELKKTKADICQLISR